MKESFLLTGDALKAGAIIQALVKDRVSALAILMSEANKNAEKIISDNNAAVKTQWDIIAKQYGLDPDKDWGRYQLITEYMAEHGHIYIAPHGFGAEEPQTMASGSMPVGPVQ